jgi:N12 class adenine-specific DNA methylase
MRRGGRFQEALERSGSKVRKERAHQISSSAERAFRRKKEDLQADLEELLVKKDIMLDMSPNNTHSIISAENFDGNEFSGRYHEICLRIRETKINLEVAMQAYDELFGTN